MDQKQYEMLQDLFSQERFKGILKGVFQRTKVYGGEFACVGIKGYKETAMSDISSGGGRIKAVPAFVGVEIIRMIFLFPKEIFHSVL